MTSKYKPEGDFLKYRRHQVNLTKRELTKLEAKIAQNPEDLDFRLEFIKRGQRGFSGGPSVEFYRNLVWVINNQPNHTGLETFSPVKISDGYSLAKAAWLKQVRNDPTDVTVLVHASSFFRNTDLKLSAKFMRLAIARDPNTAEWPKDLAHIYSLNYINAGKEAKIYAKKAAQCMISAVEIYARNSERTYLHTYFRMEVERMATQALEQELYREATQLAQFLVDHEKVDTKHFRKKQIDRKHAYINSKNVGFAILGRVALRKKDMTSARKYADAMLRLDWSTSVDWVFADEMQKAGARSFTLEYLQRYVKGLKKRLEEPGAYEGPWSYISKKDMEEVLRNREQTLEMALSTKRKIKL